MESKGIMAQIRELLAQGMSSSEVIAMGYAPSTVWKVQRWMWRQGKPPSLQAQIKLAPAPRREIAVVTMSDGQSCLVWHPDPPVRCPGCGEPVGHWEVCPLCNWLLPMGCACPQDSPSVVEGYTFQQIGEALARH